MFRLNLLVLDLYQKIRYTPGMLSSTVSRLACPSCRKKLVVDSVRGSDFLKDEIRSGQLKCTQCRKDFPIIAGVALLVNDVAEYLVHHVKGISRMVTDEEIPKAFRKPYREAKSQIEAEHIEEDLEAERVVALYLMTHYLKAGSSPKSTSWWRPATGEYSREVDFLIQRYWDSGPFAQIQKGLQADFLQGKAKGRDTLSVPTKGDFVELGCGVGGLAQVVYPFARSYLGVDSSFASIVWARQLNLGCGPQKQQGFKVPGDLLWGTVSEEVSPPTQLLSQGEGVDFVVGDLEFCPVSPASFDVSVALNAIDMLPEPWVLPRLQGETLRLGGVAIQSCPYIWHDSVARELRARLPRSVQDSASAVEWLYQQAGFEIQDRTDHVPWLFFKHFRQLELYSVHFFRAVWNGSRIRQK